MSTSTETMTDAGTQSDGCATGETDWTAIDWRTVEIAVFKLQKRIFRASMRGDVIQVHKLQRLLMSSRAAKFLAVRRVAQDNSGKKTAGIDGVKSLTKRQRLRMAQSLRIDGSAKPVRRVWIDKPDSEEKRPVRAGARYRYRYWMRLP